MKAVHVVTVTGAQYIGILVEERELGPNRWVKLTPAYSYGLRETPQGLQRICHPPFMLESATSVEAIVASMTALREGGSDFVDLSRSAEKMRQEMRAEASGISLASGMPAGVPAGRA